MIDVISTTHSGDQRTNVLICAWIIARAAAAAATARSKKRAALRRVAAAKSKMRSASAPGGGASPQGPQHQHQQPPLSPASSHASLPQAGHASCGGATGSSLADAEARLTAALEACPSRAARGALRLATAAGAQSSRLGEFVLENALAHEAAAAQLQARVCQKGGDREEGGRMDKQRH